MSSARSATKKTTAKKTAKKPAAKKAAAKKPTTRKTAAAKTTAKKTTAAKRVTKSASSADAASAVETCRELAAIVEEHTLAELIVETKDMTLTFRRGFAPAAAAQVVTTALPAHAPSHAPAHAAEAPAPAAAAAEAAADDNLHAITSPFVGTFYRAPNPDSSPYVEVGQRVEKGQILCIVEAMKLMNEIEADVAGTVEAILVDNADAVEYGQALFKIKP
jgi:acetyl-CoA carboxylase biotin carboxyl carrier protein